VYVDGSTGAVDVLDESGDGAGADDENEALRGQLDEILADGDDEDASEVSVEDSHTAERSEAESETESEDGRDSASSSSEGEWDDTASAKASSKKRKADGISEKEEEDGQSEPEEEDSDNDSLFDASELDAISKGELSKMMSSKEEEEEEENDTHTALIKADQIRWNAQRRSYRRGLEEGLFSLAMVGKLNELLEACEEEEEEEEEDAHALTSAVADSLVHHGDGSGVKRSSVVGQLCPGGFYATSVKVCVNKPADDSSVHDWLLAYENVVQGSLNATVSNTSSSTTNGKVAGTVNGTAVKLESVDVADSSGDASGVSSVEMSRESLICDCCGMNEQSLWYTFTASEWAQWREDSSAQHQANVKNKSKLVTASSGGNHSAITVTGLSVGGVCSGRRSGIGVHGGRGADEYKWEMWLPVCERDALYLCSTLGISPAQYHAAMAVKSESERADEANRGGCGSAVAAEDVSLGAGSNGYGVILRVKLTSLVTVDLLKGSLVAHESCAEGLHSGRLTSQLLAEHEQNVQKQQDIDLSKTEYVYYKKLADVLTGLPVGKILSLGAADRQGRVFYLLPECTHVFVQCGRVAKSTATGGECSNGSGALSVQAFIADNSTSAPTTGFEWRVYTTDVDIACIIATLNKSQ
jgi:hypothetical protein